VSIRILVRVEPLETTVSDIYFGNGNDCSFARSEEDCAMEKRRDTAIVKDDVLALPGSHDEAAGMNTLSLTARDTARRTVAHF
jgi:hypothetical protein